MPLTDVTNTLIANISSVEQSTSNVPINRSTGNPAFASNVAQFVTYVAISGATTLTLPIIPITQVYIKNIDSAKILTVAWEPNGGASATVVLLNPGDQIILWCNPAGTVPGVNIITLTPSSNPCLVEYFIGG